MEQKPFSTAVADSFQDMKATLYGSTALGPSADKVAAMLEDEETRLRNIIITFLAGNIAAFSLAGDGRKATIKGRPMYALTLHALSRDFDLIVLPLVINETGAKDAVATKRWILQALALFRLDPGKMVSFTGDEAETPTVKLLDTNNVKCAAHRLSTVAKHAFKEVGLLDEPLKEDSESEEKVGTVPATKKLVQFMVRRYKARQYTDEARVKINKTLPPIEKILCFTEYSSTRFLGALLMGDRFLKNKAVVVETNAYALGTKDADPWNKWPEFKERYFVEWEDVCYVCQDLVPLMEHLSGELYVTASEMMPRVLLLMARLFRLRPGPKSVLFPAGEPPMQEHKWKSRVGPVLVEALIKVV